MRRWKDIVLAISTVALVAFPATMMLMAAVWWNPSTTNLGMTTEERRAAFAAAAERDRKDFELAQRGGPPEDRGRPEICPPVNRGPVAPPRGRPECPVTTVTPTATVTVTPTATVTVTATPTAFARAEL